MSPSSKQLRPQTADFELVNDDFDFGDPEIMEVEIFPGKYLSLREPSAEDLIQIEKISNNKSMDDIEQSLAVICTLHQPEPGKPKLSMKDAKRLRSKQIKLLSEAIEKLMGLSNDNKSSSDPESEQEA